MAVISARVRYNTSGKLMEHADKLNPSFTKEDLLVPSQNASAWRIHLLLPSLALALLITNPWFGLIDDEAFQVGSAAQPIGIVAAQFRGDQAQWHPPLPDILLHAWLRLTRNSLTLLRVPSILFFVVGIWISSRVAHAVAGPKAGTATVILGTLWPYGFHFGRYAVWLPFCFFLLAGLIHCYLRWLQQPTSNHFVWLVLVATALLYTNYMGWAFLAVVGADFLFRPQFRSRRHRTQLAIGLAILALAYAPVWRVLIQLLQIRRPALSAKSVLTFFYSLYVLFASEAVAPWALALSIPLIACMVGCSAIILLRGPRFARILYGGALILALALMLSGEINQKRVMPLGAWFLMAAGIALGAVTPRWRRWLIVGFAVIGCISWVGIISQRYYASARAFEPWLQIARTAATSVHSEDTVIASHPAFFLYLTRDLMTDEGLQSSDYKGNYGEQIQRSGIYSVRDWNAGAHPLSPHILFVATLYGTDFEPTMEASAWLDQHCAKQSVEKFVENPEHELKQKFFGRSQGSPWRIEVRRYACGFVAPAPSPAAHHEVRTVDSQPRVAAPRG